MKKTPEVLILEDSNTQAEALKYILENNSYRVSYVNNAEKALKFLSHKIPDIIISDIVMPGINGFGFCSIVKSDSRLKNIPVILLTSLSDPDDIIKGLECGADCFITKPYNESYLLSKIQYLLMNFDLRKGQSTDLGLEILFKGNKHLITSSRLQIVDLLFTTYDSAVQKNKDLVEANKELEAFSYSVSHDLRAPLRAINGFINILLKEHGNKFDDEGKRLFEIINSQSSRMELMIEGLLNFSRIGRGSILPVKMVMGPIVKMIYKDSTTPQQRKKLKLKVEKLYPSFADPSLIRHVWSNLISNAIKYSAGADNPTITISSLKKDGQIIYSVNDNGVGFDMNYYDKLFGVFQRLHSEKEFEGTGVGSGNSEKNNNAT